ncbi:histone H1-like [Leptopilina boulardi]|uniref:histone H1-like n=1 Tax=Leptopilina boulardi TaxID=63433 RepID=UPI0021F690A4|nr:histone H1-like [Leptopilina boulardi]
MSEGKVIKKHPPTSEMVTVAIKELHDRKGSSLQAIKKYVAATYEIDADKFAPFIKKFLKTAVANGVIAQPKGHGASGSFKLSVKDKNAKPSARKTTLIKRAPRKAKKIVAEKKKTTKVGGKKPKVKSTTARPKVTKAKKASSKKVPITKAKRSAKKSVK